MGTRSLPASRLRALECSSCAQSWDVEQHGTCPACRAPLLCRYDLAGLAAEGLAAEPGRRGDGVFRWSALLPVRNPDAMRSAGEGDSPFVSLPRLAEELTLASLHVKDESLNPGGSFKARGMAVAVAAHAERGARAITLPSAGNAGGAAASYARRHGLSCRVALPAAASAAFRLEARLHGARVVAVTGDLGACGDWVRSHPGADDDHVLATFSEPFRVEGKKTMAFELWERFGERMPDALVYPTGGGTGLVAIEKAFAELREAGLWRGTTPRLVAAQSDACAPVARAVAQGAPTVEAWEGSRRTLAEGLRVPRLAGGALVLRALTATGGTAQVVSDGDLIDAIRLAAARDGVLLGAEGGVALAALRALRSRGELEGAAVVVFNTGSIYKSPETLAAAGVG